MKKSKSKPKQKKQTQSALAAQLGVSRQLIAAHRKKSDAPALDDLAGWISYFAQKGRIGSAPDDLRRAIAQERLEILKETKVKLARENQVEDGKLMRIADAKIQNSKMWAFVMERLYRAENEFPPAFVGCSAVQIFQMLHDFGQRLLRDARSMFEGEEIAASEYEARKLSDETESVLRACDSRAWEEKIHHEWNSFLEWRKKDEAERAAGRRAWCQKRAAAGLPVPDASDAELAAHPGLKRTE